MTEFKKLSDPDLKEIEGLREQDSIKATYKQLSGLFEECATPNIYKKKKKETCWCWFLIDDHENIFTLYHIGDSKFPLNAEEEVDWKINTYSPSAASRLKQFIKRG